MRRFDEQCPEVPMIYGPSNMYDARDVVAVAALVANVIAMGLLVVGWQTAVAVAMIAVANTVAMVLTA